EVRDRADRREPIPGAQPARRDRVAVEPEDLLGLGGLAVLRDPREVGHRHCGALYSGQSALTIGTNCPDGRPRGFFRGSVPERDRGSAAGSGGSRRTTPRLLEIPAVPRAPRLRRSILRQRRARTCRVPRHGEGETLDLQTKATVAVLGALASALAIAAVVIPRRTSAPPRARVPEAAALRDASAGHGQVARHPTAE